MKGDQSWPHMVIGVKNYEDTADPQQLCPHTQGNQLPTYPLCKGVVDKNHTDVIQ